MRPFLLFSLLFLFGMGVKAQNNGALTAYDASNDTLYIMNSGVGSVIHEIWSEQMGRDFGTPYIKMMGEDRFRELKKRRGDVLTVGPKDSKNGRTERRKKDR